MSPAAAQGIAEPLWVGSSCRSLAGSIRSRRSVYCIEQVLVRTWPRLMLWMPRPFVEARDVELIQDVWGLLILPAVLLRRKRRRTSA